MSNDTTILVLSRYSDIFEGLQENLNLFAPTIPRVLVKDGHLIDSDKDWLVEEGPSGKFNYATNVNRGLNRLGSKCDVLLLGDDVRFHEPITVETLRYFAYAESTIGLLSPKIIGASDNPLQTDPPMGPVFSYSERYIPLVCTYIKREVLNKVKGLDEETFREGWGWDDVDFSRRVRLAGYSLAVTSRVSVIHGLRRKGSETLIRNERGSSESMDALDAINAKAYFDKWGDNKK